MHKTHMFALYFARTQCAYNMPFITQVRAHDYAQIKKVATFQQKLTVSNKNSNGPTIYP